MSRARTKGGGHGEARGRRGRAGSAPEPEAADGASSRPRTSRARTSRAGASGTATLERSAVAVEAPPPEDPGLEPHPAPDDAQALEQEAPNALRGGPRLPRSPRQRMLLACTAVLAVGLLGVLMLNTIISQGAFRQFELEVALTLTSEKEGALAAQVDLAEAPKQVEKRARALGMVPAASPVFLRLSDGKVLGEPVAAVPEPGKVSLKDAPGILPTPKPSPSASASDPASAGAEDPSPTGTGAGADGAAADGAVVPSPSAGTDPSAVGDAAAHDAADAGGAGVGGAALPGDAATSDAATVTGGAR